MEFDVDPLVAVIVAGEVGFWVVRRAGLAARYLMCRRTAGAVLLACTPLVDLVVLGATRAGPASAWRSIRAWSAGPISGSRTAPPPWRPPRSGPERVHRPVRRRRRAVAAVLANGKFLALLTLLFGVGLELQYCSARRRGARWPGWYLWRAVLLLVEGLLHYVLVFEFDVLMSYAVTSMLVAYLIGRSDRAVRTWMIAAGMLHVALVALLTVGLMAAPAEQAPVTSDLFARGGYPDQVAWRGDLRDRWAHRFRSQGCRPQSALTRSVRSCTGAGAMAVSHPAGRAPRRHTPWSYEASAEIEGEVLRGFV